MSLWNANAIVDWRQDVILIGKILSGNVLSDTKTGSPQVFRFHIFWHIIDFVLRHFTSVELQDFAVTAPLVRSTIIYKTSLPADIWIIYFPWFFCFLEGGTGNVPDKFHYLEICSYNTIMSSTIFLCVLFNVLIFTIIVEFWNFFILTVTFIMWFQWLFCSLLT